MNPQELATKCVASINFCTENSFPTKDARLTLTTPKGWRAPPKWPRGDLYQVKEDGRRIWGFSAVKVLAWLAGNGLVKVEAKTR